MLLGVEEAVSIGYPALSEARVDSGALVCDWERWLGREVKEEWDSLRNFFPVVYCPVA